MKLLFFFWAATLPLAVLGQELSKGFFLNPSIVLGAMLAGLQILASGVTKRALAVLVMVVCFATTAIGHPIASYALSIFALTIVLLPATMQMPNKRQTDALLSGYKVGVIFTLAFMWLEIILQLVGLSELRDMISGQFTDTGDLYRAGNFFAFYYRPYATFNEPAHLGLFLAISVPILDKLQNQSSKLLTSILIVSVFFVGSLVGYVLVLAHLFTKTITQLVQIITMQRRIRRGKMILGTLVLALTTLIMPTVFDIITESDMITPLADRFDRLLLAVSSREQYGSEGSRANAIFLLEAYWLDTGIQGFLFGEGYGNYEDWLYQRYSYLGSLSTAGRGEVDNMLVAVFISTGLFGFLTYLTFLASLVRAVPIGYRLQLLTTLLILQFGNGFLLLYLNWHLVFMLMVTFVVHSQRLSADKQLPHLMRTSLSASQAPIINRKDRRK